MAFRNKELASKAGKLSTRKGIPNRTTKQVREAFQMLINNNIEQMQSDIDALTPKDRLKFIIDLSKFVLPQLQAVSMESSGKPKGITVNIVEPDADEKRMQMDKFSKSS